MLQLLDPPDRVLAKLAQVRALVAEIWTVDEAKDLADKAEAIRVYTMKAGYGVEFQNAATEIVLRARRRIGELTAALPTNQGDRRDLTSTNDGTSTPDKLTVLRDAGIKQPEASRCEQIAAIPATEFEKQLAVTKEEGKKLTMGSMVKAAKKYQPPAPPKPVPAVLPANVELYCDDARSISLYVGDADLILTSPPYGLEKDYPEWEDDPEQWAEFMADWLCQAYAVARDGGRLALNIPLDSTRGGFRPTYAQAVTAAIGVGWTYRASIVWNEGNVTHSTGRGSVDSPNSPHVIAPVEMVALFGKGEWDRKRQGEASDLTHAEWLEWTNGLWTFPGESRPWEGHPAAFPEELPRRLSNLLSFPGDIVVDPFLGSATTAIVAKRLGRKFVGLDISEAYIDSAKRRLAAMRA